MKQSTIISAHERIKQLRILLWISSVTWIVGIFAASLVSVQILIAMAAILFAVGIRLILICIKGWDETYLLGTVNLLSPVWIAIYATAILKDIGSVISVLFFTGIPIAIVLAHATQRSWQNRFVAYPKWQCRTCGYALMNLDSHQCPECGLVFDPQAVKDAMVDMDQVVD